MTRPKETDVEDLAQRYLSHITRVLETPAKPSSTPRPTKPSFWVHLQDGTSRLVQATDGLEARRRQYASPVIGVEPILPDQA